MPSPDIPPRPTAPRPTAPRPTAPRPRPQGPSPSAPTSLGQASARPLLTLFLALLFLEGCATNRFEQPRPGTTQRGIASWYGEPFHGRATASGEIYDMHGMTAAHKELPLGTVVDVVNLENGRKVRVRVNDRGPFIRGRILDLSYAAARQLGVVGPGTAKVEIEVVSLGQGPSGPNMATRYTVQLGAFRDAANAQRLHRELLESYADAELIRTGQWHRVRVGSFGRQSDAEALRRELAKKGYSAMVIALN